MGKIEQKFDFDMWIQIWNILAIPSKGNENFWNMSQEWKWKKIKFFVVEIWNEKNWKFSFFKFEMKIVVWNLNFFWPYH
jgi:hypothetical protein